MAARWRRFDAAKVRAALRRATCPALKDAAMPLNRQPNIADPDDFYRELIDSQRGLSDAQAEMLTTKLVLILANHVATARCCARPWRWRATTRWPRRT